jgi:hypothetical protein
MNLAMLISTAAAVVWRGAVTLWLWDRAGRSIADQPQHNADDRRTIAAGDLVDGLSPSLTRWRRWAC